MPPRGFSLLSRSFQLPAYIVADDHRVFLGIKPSIGMFYDINKIRLSLETFYMKNITKLSKFDGVKANTFLLSFGIGYKL